jgi:SNF2 family DNA or RNA helicase
MLNLLSDQSKQTEIYLDNFYKEKFHASVAPLAVPAYQFQNEAASMGLRMKGLLLADDLGLGKTVSFIALLTNRETLPAVVVPLAHLPQQWYDMIKQFAPHLRVHIVKTKSVYKIKPHDVYIVNYHKLSGWAETFAKIAKTVCFDECQELRRQGSAKYIAAKYLSANTEFHMGLSATPIYNYGGEIFNVLDVLSPGKLGSSQEFEREWCTSVFGKQTLKDPVAFGNYLRNSGLMLRRTRKEVKREIPPVQVFNQYVDADLNAIQEVESNCLELAQFILSGTEVNRGDKMRASEEFDMRLRQATGIAKAPHVANFVRILIENGEKVLLFGWHREVYKIWNRLLFDVNPVMYTGSESPKQKNESKEEFINGKSQLMIMSNRSGAGTDGLQKVCKTVVNGELDWSPGVHEQNLGRIARDGQEYPVIGYNLISKHGSDPVIADIIGLKKYQVEGIRNPDKPLVEKLQADPLHIKKLAQQYLENHLRK